MLWMFIDLECMNQVWNGSKQIGRIHPINKINVDIPAKKLGSKMWFWVDILIDMIFWLTSVGTGHIFKNPRHHFGSCSSYFSVYSVVHVLRKLRYFWNTMKTESILCVRYRCHEHGREPAPERNHWESRIPLSSNHFWGVFHVRFLDFVNFFEKLRKFYTKAVFFMSKDFQTVKRDRRTFCHGLLVFVTILVITFPGLL